MAISYNTYAVTESLVLSLDAANVKSYPGTGNSWYDLSGNNYHATLYNSPIFSSNTIQFRSVSNQYAISTFDEGLLKGANKTGAFTIEAVFKQISASSTNESFIAGRLGCHGGIYVNTDNTLQHAIKTDQCWTGASVVTAATMTYGDYYHTTMVYSNGITTSYLNGLYVGTATMNIATYTFAGYSNSFMMGGSAAAGFYQTNTDIASIKCYKKALSTNEVYANFTAVRGRYGL
jgi:hypothetical protein